MCIVQPLFTSLYGEYNVNEKGLTLRLNCVLYIRLSLESLFYLSVESNLKSTAF